MCQNLNSHGRHLPTFKLIADHPTPSASPIVTPASISFSACDRFRLAISTCNFDLHIQLASAIGFAAASPSVSQRIVHFRLRLSTAFTAPFRLAIDFGLSFSLRLQRMIWACAYLRACSFEPFGFPEHLMFDCDSSISPSTLRLPFG
jgi:hypothetical protein